ncbi:MAG TPA: bifunctional phosphopantothenoylcysteine decarboxylase/phosphopantothenate--cysteine ligase CoaBC [Solirubrobacteraceae bacterium]|nr:bifunctional phosphopantothenoylcysteine decarboxylase/phosphopantothenate--cysteine ligase CoaBC [Solirubrobacteraceae bacterium]
MRLLIGVSGGIAAYKALETARLAVKAGHSVRVIQTPTSERFVGRASFAGITGAPVLTSEFEEDPARGTYPGEPLPERAPISHLALVERADVYLIAPASANTIAKLALGAADNLVSTAALAAACPVAVAPAMNNRMYLNPATQANLKLLTERGLTVVWPGEGALASHGERGIGRLAEPEALLAACELLAAPSSPQGTLAGVSVLVTAGGTQEPIDSVRYVGNRSSGRMGFALAQAAAARGAKVTVVAANVKLDAPAGVEVVPVRTAAQLAQACEARFEAVDVLLMAAAVADFRPAEPVEGKLKKTGPEAPTRIELEPTEDVLAALAARRRDGQLLVGFAAEHGDGAAAYGREKLERKRLDAIVVNDVSQPGIGFDAAENEVLILTRDGAERLIAQTSKRGVAEGILDEVVRLRTESLSTQPTVVG